MILGGTVSMAIRVGNDDWISISNPSPTYAGTSQYSSFIRNFKHHAECFYEFMITADWSFRNP